MTLTQKASYIIQLPLEEKAWLIAFFIGSLISRIAILALPMNKLTRFMGHHLENRMVCIPASQKNTLTAIKMGRLMNMVSNNVPWKCACLSEALCLKWLLNRYRIPYVLYLGATLTSTSATSIKAHAWVDVGEQTIIDNYDDIDYRVTATFTSMKLN